MGKPSSIETLPPDILERLQELLRDPRVTQLDATKEINKILAKQGLEPRSKSAVNRYAISFNDVLEKKRQSNEVMKAWIGQVGDIPDGDFGRGIVEIVRTLAFDMSLLAHQSELTTEKLPGSVKMLKELAVAVEKIERAASENEKRAAQIRQQALEETAEKLDELGRKPGSGIDADTLKRIRREVYGLAE